MTAHSVFPAAYFSPHRFTTLAIVEVSRLFKPFTVDWQASRDERASLVCLWVTGCVHNCLSAMGRNTPRLGNISSRNFRHRPHWDQLLRLTQTQTEMPTDLGYRHCFRRCHAAPSRKTPEITTNGRVCLRTHNLDWFDHSRAKHGVKGFGSFI